MSILSSFGLACALLPSYARANVGIATNSPVVGLEVASTGSASAILFPRDSTANRPTAVNGMVRYNTSANAMEMFVNGGWVQVAAQPLGSTANVVATGPASTAVYAPTAITCNYTPGFGACSNLNSGIWQGNGYASAGNSNCVQLQGTTSQAIVYDLGANRTINNVYITQENNLSTNLGLISFSTDNVTFTSSTGFSPNNYYGGTLYSGAALSPNVSARYVRLMNGAGQANSGDGAYCNLAVGP